MANKTPDLWQRRGPFDVEAYKRLTKQTVRLSRRKTGPPNQAISGEASAKTAEFPVDAATLEESVLSDSRKVFEFENNATTLRAFAEYSQRIGLDPFLSRYPFHFLIQETQMTADFSSGAQMTDTGTDMETRGPVDLFAAVVYRLAKKSHNEGTDITVGRAVENDVFIDNNRISKVHAHFQQLEDGWYLTDSGSTNGTFVDGVELEPGLAHRLKINARICFSEEAAFRFLDNHRMCNHVKFFGLHQEA
jgi:hypothetical protein